MNLFETHQTHWFTHVQHYIWNEDGVVPVPGPLSEGEKEAEKVIQYPKNSDDDSEKPDEQHDDTDKDKLDNDQQHKTNSVPFPQDPAAN